MTLREGLAAAMMVMGFLLLVGGWVVLSMEVTS
jgi:hypothetical protein